MKFEFAYRDRNNERHDGTIVASSKDDAFRKLKARGIRPLSVALAPGLFNRIQSFGKRGLAIAVLALVAVVSTTVAFRVANDPQVLTIEQYFDAPTRRQIMGDQWVIDKGVRDSWADVFELEGDRFLAAYAVPGNPVPRLKISDETLLAAVGKKCLPTPEDSLEARQIKAMVEGLKDELRQFVADGGTVSRYVRRLAQRQAEEIGYYQRAKNEIANLQKGNASEAMIAKRLDDLNASLRNMGIRLISLGEN